MAVKYKVVSRRPGGIAGERTPKYFPMVTKRELRTTRDVAEEISVRNSFHPADVIGVIESLIRLVPAMLQDGNNVKLDGFGTFSLHVAGLGREDPEKVTKRDITKVSISFLPDKRIKHQLKYTEFVKVK